MVFEEVVTPLSLSLRSRSTGLFASSKFCSPIFAVQGDLMGSKILEANKKTNTKLQILNKL